jgi:hypothetical protein
VKERRGGHLGTISGLALLTGATALAAVAGGRHSIFATLLLGLLSLGMTHSLFVEIRRQARRHTPWTRHDTINTAVLAAYGEAALMVTLIPGNPEPLRAVGPFLSLVYAASCALFVTERRRAIATLTPATAQPPVPDSAEHGTAQPRVSDSAEHGSTGPDDRDFTKSGTTEPSIPDLAKRPTAQPNIPDLTESSTAGPNTTAEPSTSDSAKRVTA